MINSRIDFSNFQPVLEFVRFTAVRAGKEDFWLIKFQEHKQYINLIESRSNID